MLTMLLFMLAVFFIYVDNVVIYVGSVFIYVDNVVIYVSSVFIYVDNVVIYVVSVFIYVVICVGTVDIYVVNSYACSVNKIFK